MTREEFFEVAGIDGRIYMFNDRIKKSWERILPEDGIISFYQTKNKCLENGTYDVAYFILTEKYLINITITANQLNSKAYLFKPYCIEKNFRIVNDCGYGSIVDEVKIYMDRDDISPIVIEKPDENRNDFTNYLDFISKLT